MAKGISLNIGLNAVNPLYYNGDEGKLNACENDAMAMKEIAISQGFEEPRILIGSRATKNRFRKLLNDCRESLEAGDLFLLTFSGHGGQIKDTEGEEADGRDETWCLYDGMVTDDEIYQQWQQFREDVKIWVISDSCHSGTVTRGFFDEKKGRKFQMGKNDRKRSFDPLGIRRLDANILPSENQVLASVRLFSGCRDWQYSRDGQTHGRFTEALLTAWGGGNFFGNYQEFFAAIVKQMSYTQLPAHGILGKPNKVFDNARPFKISSY